MTIFPSPVTPITVVDSGYCRPELAAVYLLVDGDEVAIIETATSPAANQVLEALRQCGFVPGQVRYIIPTHVHLDHAGGAGVLMQHCTEATLLIHPKGAHHMIDPSRLLAGTIQVYGQQRTRELYGEIIPIAASRIRNMEDGEQLRLGGLTLQFMDTPGHASHHFCIHIPQLKTLFSGDTLGIAYPALQQTNKRFIFASTTPVQFQPQLLLESIDRLKALNADWAALTHFGLHRLNESYFIQLRNSVTCHRDIALACHRASIPGMSATREQRIAKQLQQHFHQQLSLNETELTDLLGNDIRLNAMGLETWLSRSGK